MEKQKLWVLLAVMGLTAGITACSGQKGTEPARIFCCRLAKISHQNSI